MVFVCVYCLYTYLSFVYSYCVCIHLLCLYTLPVFVTSLCVFFCVNLNEYMTTLVFIRLHVYVHGFQ